MCAAIETELPRGVVALRCWRHAGIDCAVGDLAGTVLGLARLGHRRSGWSRVSAGDPLPESEWGPWVLLRPAPARQYCSVEVLARYVTPGTPELAAWTDSAEVWAIERVARIVEEFVDTVPKPIGR